MHSYSRRHPIAFAWALILSLLLSACMATDDRGDSSASSPAASDGGGRDASPSSPPAEEAADGEASQESTGSGVSGSDGSGSGSGSGSDSGRSRPQGPNPAPAPQPPAVPRQPQGPGPAQPPGPPAPNQPPAPPPAPPAPGQPPALPPGPPAPAQPPAPETVVLDWLPIGPVGRNDPIWYLRLRDLHCESLPGFPEPFNTVEEAARTLCLGLKGDEAAWDAGVSALSTSPTDCWSVAAHEILSNIAAVRTQKPDAIVELAPRPGTACVPELTGLLDDEGNNEPLLVCAGAVIILDGSVIGLPSGTVRSVSVGTTTAPVSQRQSFTNNNFPLEFYFLAPPLTQGQSTTADVSIADSDWLVQGTVSLEYGTCPQRPGAAP